MKTNKTFQKWFKRVKDIKTPWTENEIKYFRKQLGMCSTLSTIEREELLAEFGKNGCYKITREQSLKGYEYIKNLVFKKNGQLRRSKENFADDEMAQCIQNFKAFKFVGVVKDQWNGNQYEPVFEVLDTQGRSFFYTGVHKSAIRAWR